MSQENQITLEAGKTYRSRQGDKVTIRDWCLLLHPFIGQNRKVYTREGKYFSTGKESQHDLVEEVGRV